MPQNSIAPKPEYCSSRPVEGGTQEMSEHNNSTVLAYPIQTNEHYLSNMNLFPITLKVSPPRSYILT